MTGVEEAPSEITTSVRDGVAEVTLDAPGRMNALTPAMADELVAALDRVEADPSVATVVIRGAGGAFCAGADTSGLVEVIADPASDGAYLAIERIYAAFVRLGGLGLPTIAAVRGPAVGAGLNLALAADVRIVARDCRLRSGFTRLGLHPGGGHLHLLARATSPQAAAAMAIFGEDVDGQRAVELGLAWRAVDDEDVDAEALELASVAGPDPDLARRVAASLRTTALGASWPLAVQAERAPQLWSLRRAEASRLRSSDPSDGDSRSNAPSAGWAHRGDLPPA